MIEMKTLTIGGNTYEVVDDTARTEINTLSTKIADETATREAAVNELKEAIANKDARLYNAKEYGAVGDGVTDDSAALNELIGLVGKNGGGTIFLPKGVYMLDSALIWKSNVSLVGEGVGISVLKTRQAEGVGVGFSAIKGVNCTNCTFEQFTIDGEEMNITSYTFNPKGVFIQYMTDCVFRDIVIKNTGATGLGIDFLQNVAIDNVACYNCGRGWVGSGSEANVGGAGIGIGTKRMDGECFVIRNCITDGCGNYGIFLEDQGGGTASNNANFVIANNIVKNGRNHGIVVKGGDRVIIANNVVYNNAEHGIAILENNAFLSDIIKITNNLSYNNKSGFVVNCNGTTEDVFVSDNVFSDCEYGIRIMTGVSDLELMRNTIKTCANPVVLAAVTLKDFVYWHNILIGNDTTVENNATFTGDPTYNELYSGIGAPTGIAFSADSSEMKVGNVKTLSVIFTPEGTTGAVTFESDAPDVVSVTGNTATAMAEGTAVITATCGTLTATHTITVETVADVGGNLWDSSAALLNGQFVSSSGTLTSSTDQVTSDGLIGVSGLNAVSFDIPNVSLSDDATWRLIEYDANQTYVTRTIGLLFGKIVKIQNGTEFVKIGISAACGTSKVVTEDVLDQIRQNAVLIGYNEDSYTVYDMADYAYEIGIHNDSGDFVSNAGSGTTVDYFPVTESTYVDVLVPTTSKVDIAYVSCFDKDKIFIGRYRVSIAKGTWQPCTLSIGTAFVKFRFGKINGTFSEADHWDGCLVRMLG